MPLIFVVETDQTLLWNLHLMCFVFLEAEMLDFHFYMGTRTKPRQFPMEKSQSLGEKGEEGVPCGTGALQQPWNTLNNLPKQMCHQQNPKSELGPENLI